MINQHFSLNYDYNKANFAVCTFQLGVGPFSDKLPRSKIRQSKINLRSVAGPMGEMNRQPSV